MSSRPVYVVIGTNVVEYDTPSEVLGVFDRYSLAVEAVARLEDLDYVNVEYRICQAGPVNCMYQIEVFEQHIREIDGEYV